MLPPLTLIDFFLRDMKHKKRCFITLRGKHLRVQFSSNTPKTPPTKKRGTVRGFSAKSRLRLLKAIAEMDWNRIPRATFVTLTYPDSVAIRKPSDRNVDRYLLHRWFEGNKGKHLPGIWRLEWVPRKSGTHRGVYLPHFHLLLFDHLDIGKNTIREFWRKTIDAEGVVQIDVKRMENAKQAGLYVSKYMGKPIPLLHLDNLPYLNIAGRQWGFFRKNDIPLEQLIHVVDPSEKAIRYAVLAACAKLTWIDPRNPQSFSLIGDFATYVADKLAEIGVDTR